MEVIETGQRDWASRILVAEDARWIADIAFSSATAGGRNPYPGLLIGHHFARITYEGQKFLRSLSDPSMSPLADLMRDDHQSATANIRHASKLLDDSGRTYDDILAEVERAAVIADSAFIQSIPGLARWLAKDLGLYFIDGLVVGNTIGIATRLKMNLTDTASKAGQAMEDVAREWGRNAAVLMAAARQTPLDTGSLDLSSCRITSRDVRAGAYLESRFAGELSPDLKLLLLLIEGDLNASRLYLPVVEHGHWGPVFRARWITTYHAVTSLQKILNLHPEIADESTRAIRSLLDDARTRRIVSKSGTDVRKRCFHYDVKDRRILPDWSLPMFGIIETVSPGATMQSLNDHVQSVASELAQILGAWRP